MIKQMEEVVGSIHDHEESKLLAKNTSKLNSRQTQGFNIHDEIKNVLEENTDELFHNLGVDKDYKA